MSRSIFICRSTGIPIRGRSSSARRGRTATSLRARFIASRIASNVSIRVPSMSNRSSSMGPPSLLRLLVELPERVADVVDGPHGLPLLRGDHLRPCHQGLPDRERAEVLLVPHPHDVTHPDPRG